MFVHLTPESRAKLIQRVGIGRLRKATNSHPGGIFAMPVMRSFYVSHQWLRELKRRGSRTIVGVYFRLNDDQEVWVGHYSRAHQKMTAADATSVMMAAEDRQGFEVIIPRRIEKGEIHRVRTLPQVIGWRYSPTAKGNRPCGCDFCQRGDYGARKIRERYEAEMR